MPNVVYVKGQLPANKDRNPHGSSVIICVMVILDAKAVDEQNVRYYWNSFNRYVMYSQLCS